MELVFGFDNFSHSIVSHCNVGDYTSQFFTDYFQNILKPSAQQEVPCMSKQNSDSEITHNQQ